MVKHVVNVDLFLNVGIKPTSYSRVRNEIPIHAVLLVCGVHSPQHVLHDCDTINPSLLINSFFKELRCRAVSNPDSYSAVAELGYRSEDRLS